MLNLFVGELQKSVKKRALIGMGIAFVVILILMAIVVNVLNDMIVGITTGSEDILNEMGMGQSVSKPESKDFYTTDYLSLEELDQMIAVVKENVKEAKAAYEKDKKNGFAEYYYVKSQLAVLEYAKAHGYYNKKVYILGMNYNSMSGTEDATSGESFVSMYSAIVALVVMIYGLILGASLYANEYRNGTIKLVMVRPITKNRLTLAKLLSLYATLTVFYFVPVLIGFAYGGIVFGSEATKTILYSFNATSAGASTIGGMMFGEIVVTWLQILIMASIAFSLGTIARKPAIGLLVTLAIQLNIGSFLALLGIKAFLLSDAVGLMKYFGLNQVQPYSNFYISLAIVVFWTAAAIVSLFVVTDKRDVI